MPHHQTHLIRLGSPCVDIVSPDVDAIENASLAAQWVSKAIWNGARPEEHGELTLNEFITVDSSLQGRCASFRPFDIGV